MPPKFNSFRLFEFGIKDVKFDNQDTNINKEDGDGDGKGNGNGDGDGDGNSKPYQKKKKKDELKFMIQMFGKNEKGKSCSIIVKDYTPFFYVKIPDSWGVSNKLEFMEHIKDKVLGEYYKDGLVECKLVKRKKLYGFDGGKLHKFLVLKFTNMRVYYKVRGLWYNRDKKLQLYKGFQRTSLELYEANIPPLLRFFHIKEISPSGWISLSEEYKVHTNKTTCDYEYEVNYKKIIALPNKETLVPFKICSFDIEASSSHGDFPLPKKNYRKLANQMVEKVMKFEGNDELLKQFFHTMVRNAFGFGDEDIVDIIYTKKVMTEAKVLHGLTLLMEMRLEDLSYQNNKDDYIERWFERISVDDNDDSVSHSNHRTIYKIQKGSLLHLLTSDASKDEMLERLTDALNRVYPSVEGDKVTFIGSTFTNYGEDTSYLNHCVVLGTCSDIPNVTLESYKTEAGLLVGWTKMIQRENPDIIIGYNQFGFDYAFMFERAKQSHCVMEFLMLSRNRGELCGTSDRDSPGEIKIEETSIILASGQHDLQFVKIPGRLQVDLYNYFRRNVNLDQYKLDYVAGHFIGDNINKVEPMIDKKQTKIYSKNLDGLRVNDYLCFEEIEHTTDKYNEGEKFKVMELNRDEKWFIIQSMVQFKDNKQIRWCMAKDDVTPQDIFRLTGQGPDERAIVAKYCIQDCNLVFELLKKIDIITEFIEMSKLCSVPIEFLVMRGQGIKLTSFISKKCREKNTLMPMIDKSEGDEGYEGAIVLEPKCNLYLDDPVACVDYSSLYPSSMISENLCHSSKVSTKEFDLEGNLITETGDSVFDNLEGYEYVDIQYDTFKYVRKTPKAAATKVKTGHKQCRFAQYPNNEKAILPAVLSDLLAARKATKKLKAQETNPFMANVYDKRQISIKLTANSLYGQTGAKTSTFYEPDVAASTTAVGRKLLTYAKRVIEEVYGDTVMESKKYGKVKSNAKYIYGDTDSVFFCFYFTEIDGTTIKGFKALDLTIELAQEVGAVATHFLKKPHDLEYEKTFLPFCLLSKKRYVGILYEFDPNKGKCKSMGIVLKRRDNAPIVKDVYGGIIDILMKEQNIVKAIDYLQACLQNIVDEKYGMDKLIITKSLRSIYKKPDQIAHKVLADRIAKRDPGNKPKAGDRIPFVFIVNPNKKALQGEKIELPNYVLDNAKTVKIDYAHYITNQIMKPVQQLFALVLDDIPAFNCKMVKMRRFYKELEGFKHKLTDEKYKAKEEQLKNKEVKALLFDKYLKLCKKDNQISIKDYF
jgi:DNA polymerase elongation subunit (family B)